MHYHSPRKLTWGSSSLGHLKRRDCNPYLGSGSKNGRRLQWLLFKFQRFGKLCRGICGAAHTPRTNVLQLVSRSKVLFPQAAALSRGSHCCLFSSPTNTYSSHSGLRGLQYCQSKKMHRGLYMIWWILMQESNLRTHSFQNSGLWKLSSNVIVQGKKINRTTKLRNTVHHTEIPIGPFVLHLHTLARHHYIKTEKWKPSWIGGIWWTRVQSAGNLCNLVRWRVSLTCLRVTALKFDVFMPRK